MKAPNPRCRGTALSSRALFSKVLVVLGKIHVEGSKAAICQARLQVCEERNDCHLDQPQGEGEGFLIIRDIELRYHPQFQSTLAKPNPVSETHVLVL